MMSFTEQLLERICIAVNGTCESVVDGKTINFKAPYRRLPILDAIKEKTGYDLNGKSEDEIRTICKDLNLEIDETMGKGKLIDEIFGEFCEGTFIQPTFIIDYPVEMSPLTKMHRSKPGLTERFELMINGKEVANAYSELNDPIDQEERFKEQLRLSEKEMTKRCSSTRTFACTAIRYASDVWYRYRHRPSGDVDDWPNDYSRSVALPADAPGKDSQERHRRQICRTGYR